MLRRAEHRRHSRKQVRTAEGGQAVFRGHDPVFDFEDHTNEWIEPKGRDGKVGNPVQGDVCRGFGDCVKYPNPQRHEKNLRRPAGAENLDVKGNGTVYLNHHHQDIHSHHPNVRPIELTVIEDGIYDQSGGAYNPETG